MSDANNKKPERRTSTVKLRLKETEQIDWHEQADAEGITLSNLIRKRMTGAKPTDVEPKKKRRMGRKADPALLAVLGRVGNNLNQIARWANTHTDAAEARQVIAALVAIESILLSYRPMPGGHDAPGSDDNAS